MSGLVSSPRTGPPSSGVRPPLEYFPLPFPVPLVPISAIDSLRRLFASSRNLLFRFSRDVRPAAVDSLLAAYPYSSLVIDTEKTSLNEPLSRPASPNRSANLSVEKR